MFLLLGNRLRSYGTGCRMSRAGVYQLYVLWGVRPGGQRVCLGNSQRITKPIQMFQLLGNRLGSYGTGCRMSRAGVYQLYVLWGVRPGGQRVCLGNSQTITKPIQMFLLLGNRLGSYGTGCRMSRAGVYQLYVLWGVRPGGQGVCKGNL